MTGWELEIGFYPGVLAGLRTYTYDNGDLDYVLYLPFVCLILNVYKDG